MSSHSQPFPAFLSRRNMLAGAAAALTAACAGPVARRPDSDTLTFGSPASNDDGYDPRVTLSRNEEQVILQIFDQLVVADCDNSLHPGLARSWKVADDFRSIALELRDDVHFHDGTPFDAGAVKFTFDTIVDPKTGSMGAIDVIGPYEGADILGRHAIRLRYREAFPRVLHALADIKASIVCPAAVRRLGNRGFAQAPVGTGPFRFVSWTKGDQVVLARNPDYRWGPAFLPTGPARIERVVHRFIPNAFTRVAALDAGEIDICAQTPPLDTRSLVTGGGYKAMVGVAQGLPFGFSLNSSRGPFADRDVRRAFMMAIDRPWLSRNLFFGLADPAWGPLASSIPEYWAGVKGYYPYDPAGAAALLDRAGWRTGPGGIRQRGGMPLALYLPIFIEPELGVAIQAQARRAGFDIRIEQVTRQKQDELMFGNGYDLLSQRWDHNDASVLEIPFLSRNIPVPGRYSFNWARIHDPALDAMLGAAAEATTQERRSALYADAQRRIMDAAVFLPIHEQVQTIVHPERVSGLRYASGNWQVRLAGASL
ncbi:peptide/nickel transport system substrate-binding protein [Sphingomonas sp. YR710]|uniref:ABC transporter substrate-binding protein n=1 Tax=Sphingomonas sp. YR710 TaxID=1882773 RepID=UPI000889AB30|nr:ABC transporter substrate-binding protein [Sphingomonas sp. YR710]SDD48486.1 peptide/nickel transport system substrate-binding protein [Sphingomonas sp. YR710]